MKADHSSAPQSAKDSLVRGFLEVDMVENMFDHVPEIVFFIKDAEGRYIAVNKSLVERCGFEEKKQLLGLTATQIFPKDLAEIYFDQDQKVLQGQTIVDHLELHWYAHRKPGWCLTTKLPIFGPMNSVIGMVGISRDLLAVGRGEFVPPGLTKAMEYLESHYDEPITPGMLAQRSGLHPARFARLIKRIFGFTPSRLILQTRLSAAAKRLVETKKSIADISLDCGFYDHSALTRAFKSIINLTPTQFRKVHRENLRLGKASNGSLKE